MKLPLVGKIVAINILSLGLVIALIALAVRYLAADYFMTLVKEYNIAPEKAHGMFLEAIQRYVLGASLLGCALAVALSVWLTRRVLNPLRTVISSADSIAAGDYSTRVPITESSEITKLAVAFNHMAESLQRIERLRKDMVIHVAHELRTPLTNIRGYLEAMQDAVVTPSPEVFESLQEETFRLMKLVEDLLQLARADAAKNHLAKSAVDAAQLVSRVADLFRIKFAEKQINLRVEFEAAARHEIHADADRLLQVITNLFENAWRYTPSGGDVTAHVESAPQHLRIVIRNPCATPSPSDSALMFERFYREEKSRSREHGGAGIGLAIVKELVEAHAGQVGGTMADNIAEFWVQLPREY